jgi:hypothetical protein
MNKFEHIACHGQVVVAILGNEVTRDFELIDLAACPLAPDKAAEYTARGLGYCGTLGFVCGQFRSALAVSLDDATVSALAQAYLDFVFTKLAAPAPLPAGDSAGWLDRLFNLPDMREN